MTVQHYVRWHQGIWQVMRSYPIGSGEHAEAPLIQCNDRGTADICHTLIQCGFTPEEVADLVAWPAPVEVGDG